jgi:Zn-dependent M28 family amino/carboxypeptidase
MAANKAVSFKQGAAALIVRYRPAGPSWEEFQHHFLADRILHGESSSFPEFLINDTQAPLNALIDQASTATLKTSGSRTGDTPARNVMGWVQGTDPKLKDQFIVLTSHYDHIGVARQPKMEEGKLDSIYNGARDNAIGVAAVLNAARYFSKHPPKRSVLFINYTAEELGLIGSRHYADNPTVPLKNIVYNLNIDNASYNDTTIVTVVGLGRTSADNDIKKSCAAYGLKANPDPAPEQNLFDRSDNVSLAAKGIPAPTFSLGVTKFDSTITRRYHQLSDETGDMNMSYALKYMKAFILTAKNIADNPAQPSWIKNDKYEAAWKKLYTHVSK